ncbi:histidine phosphatase superfamily [Corynascus novoguineensis]|uniref:Histidine phosphatase superfamily n=1 Tax=Corynascus novoguineensis TaxID=1126955 RepID=A0AAN7HNM4_9PEZI|nr:histidine phosphatase superfamily [Corynascus novoguineensis]
MIHTSSLALAGLAATAVAETIHGALVFTRHGDRTAKHFGNWVLTPLGAQQVFQVGTDYRSRYLSSSSPQRIRGISEFEYVPAQVWASAPDSPVLLTTANSFLQALYPPLGDIKPLLSAQDLANGSSVESPLAGYQYVTLHGVSEDSPETIWIKGDDECPAIKAASADFKASTEYQDRLASTRDFYQSLYPLVSDLYPSAEDLSYDSAYEIFDVINVMKIHNASSPIQDVTDDQLLQLRTLADSAEFGLNFNTSQAARSIHAQTFAASVLRHLNQTVTSADRNPKLTVLAGSYDTFLAFFGLAQLTDVSPEFYGLPDYASTMAFEIFTPGDDDSDLDVSALQVRYLFRNGTEGGSGLRTFPLFGTGKTTLPWSDFVDAMQRVGVSSAGEWCRLCQSEAVFCAAYTDDNGAATAADAGETVERGSWIAVLVVMAVAIAGNLVWAVMWLVRGRRVKEERKAAAVAAKVGSLGSESIKSYGKESV